MSAPKITQSVHGVSRCSPIQLAFLLSRYVQDVYYQCKVEKRG